MLVEFCNWKKMPSMHSSLSFNDCKQFYGCSQIVLIIEMPGLINSNWNDENPDNAGDAKVFMA